MSFHLFTNFQMLTGTFQHEVNWIHSLPALIIAEWVIWLSIGFHAALGMVYTFTGKTNTIAYPYAGNWRYTGQRVTGIVALIFIFLHIATLRWRWEFFGYFTPFYALGPDGTPLAMATTANALQSNCVLVLYFIGASAAVFHFANGVWTAAITWGLTISVKSQKRWGYICAVIGVVFMVFTVGSLVGVRKYQVTEQDNAAIEAAVEHGPGHAGVYVPEHKVDAHTEEEAHEH